MSVEDENTVLYSILDLFSGNVDAKGDYEIEDNKPFSWKLSNNGSYSYTKALSGIIKPSRTTSSPRNLMKEALEKNKNSTKKRRMLKKRIDVITTVVEKVV